MSNIKTCEQLKEEWGAERYVKALGVVSAICGKYGLINDQNIPIDLSENNPDAFEVYESLIFYGSEQNESEY